MKILISTVDCWNWEGEASTALTFASLFKNVDKSDKASLYIREQTPSDDSCRQYFRISENAVIHSIFNKKIKTGRQVFFDEGKSDSNQKNLEKTKQRYKKLKKDKRRFFLLAVREFLWYIGRWKTRELDEFVDTFKPDIVIFGMEGYPCLNRINRYIIKRTGAKGVGYFWDDNFTYQQQKKTLFSLLYRTLQKHSLKKTAKMCSDFFAISEKTKEYADKHFDIDCKIITKPIDCFNEPKSSFNSQIKMVYAGNLRIGRLNSLSLLSDALKSVPECEKVFDIDIYTNTEIPPDILNSLSSAIHIKAPILASEVSDVLCKADILLFLEDVFGKHKKTAWLSFSTKLTDYMGSGKCIFAIASSELASIEYLEKNQSVLCSQTKEQTAHNLMCIKDDRNVILEHAKNAYELGLKNHSRSVIEEKLFTTLNKLCD